MSESVDRRTDRRRLDWYTTEKHVEAGLDADTDPLEVADCRLRVHGIWPNTYWQNVNMCRCYFAKTYAKRKHRKVDKKANRLNNTRKNQSSVFTSRFQS